MTTPPQSVPQSVARELAQHGVKTVYGVPGGEGSSELIQALQRSGVAFVLCHTESQAAFAAAAEAEVTGTVGVVITSLGPGAASAVNGAAHALLDRVPLLVITDRFAQESGPTSGHQFIDQKALYAPVTKWSVRLKRSGAAAQVRAAVATAQAFPQGSVHVEFPADLSNAAVMGEDAAASEAKAPISPTLVPNQLILALQAAHRPVVICGLGVTSAPARSALAELLPRLRAPALTTYKAIGTTSEAAAWNAGVFTGGTLEEAFLDQADLILTLGFDPVEMIPAAWRWQAPVLRLSADPTACSVSRPQHEAVGHMPQLMAAVASALGSHGGNSSWTEEQVAHTRSGSHAQVVDSWTVGGINPTSAVQALATAFPTAAFSVDAGAHMFAATLALSYENAFRCSISNGLATMGYALPAAIGLAHAEPFRPAVAITGDGGLGMCSAELETAVRVGHRTVVFLMNDAQLSLIKIKQEARGHQPRGVGYGPTDWQAIAGAYGARAHRAETPDELLQVLKEAAKQPRGVDLIEVVLAPDGYPGLMETVRGRKARA